MFGDKGSVGMGIDGFRTIKLKKSQSDSEGTETALQVDLRCDLTKGLAKKLGPVAERVLLAAETDQGDGDGEVHPPIIGNVKLGLASLDERYHVMLRNDKAKQKTLKLRTQKFDKLTFHCGNEPEVTVGLLAELDARSLSWIHQNLGLKVRVEFKAEQGKLC